MIESFLGKNYFIIKLASDWIITGVSLIALFCLIKIYRRISNGRTE